MVQIPGMPPTPPTDAGQGGHGSQPWYSRYDDIKFLDTIAVALAGADAAGLPNAKVHLEHYLDNTGDDLKLDPDRIMNDDAGLKRHIDGIVTKAVQLTALDVANHGKPATFQSAWEDYTFANRDWYLAIGSVEACACGVATVTPGADGAQPHVVLDYQFHLFDRYNWDGTKKTEIGGIEWSDRQLGALHTAGLAWEFNMIGSSTVKHYEGDLPTYGSLTLPPGQPQTPTPGR
ncbi:hypothetical protein F3087_27785 [Nocardia colli]|uniref:Uncharacterized protein n=1 Tax=Nocardia colli TaxID=2545717 RepID=A0A5N0E934_9NOCA|nr:hypothetical protein [Nocardia colli]KAA8885443.1 hypothetical protein F3087_27785 [Nocardia colli]